MAGLVPAIHALTRRTKNVEVRVTASANAFRLPHPARIPRALLVAPSPVCGIAPAPSKNQRHGRTARHQLAM